MTRRLAVLAVLIVVVLALGAVLAAPQRADVDTGWHDRMHASEGMRAMHQQMPEAQVDCDRMHAQMDGMRGRRGHMAGNCPMMNGPMGW